MRNVGPEAVYKLEKERPEHGTCSCLVQTSSEKERHEHGTCSCLVQTSSASVEDVLDVDSALSVGAALGADTLLVLPSITSWA